MSSLRPPDPGILQVARSEGRAGELIEAVASCLVGLPLTELTRMLDMICVGFGEVRLRPMPRDEASLTTPRKRELAERRDATPMPLLALHIQCPFRLDSPTGPFVGAQDVYRLADPPHEWIEGRPKGDFSGCLFDARANVLPTDAAAPMIVEAVHADAGGVSLWSCQGVHAAFWVSARAASWSLVR